MNTETEIADLIPQYSQWTWMLGPIEAGNINEAHRTVVRPLLDRIAQLEREAQNWQDTAAFHLRNEQYYRGLLERIGNLFGVAAKTSDDGSVQQDVLCIKVPELVESRIAWLEKEARLYKVLYRSADAMRAEMHQAIESALTLQP